MSMVTAAQLLEAAKGISLLYVEDDQALRESTATLLRNFFPHLQTAENGQIAWDKVQEAAPDLVITDIRMPVLDGIELCRRVKAKDFNLPVMVISAHDEVTYLTEMINLGVDQFLAKPLDIHQLLPKLHRLCQGIQFKKAAWETEAKRNEYLDSLRRLNQDKDRFFSIISHDLKAPFNGILGLTEYMTNHQKQFNQQEWSEIAHQLNQSAKVYYQLLLNLLDWARLQRGLMEYHPLVTELFELTEQRLAPLLDFAQQKSIEMHNHIEADILVKVDRDMIGMVIHNLITNSIKFTPKGGRIELHAEPQGDRVQMSVRDTGLGMPDKIKNKLFQLEEKVSTPGTENESGTGLGLHLCKEMLDRHQGRIWVESELGKGSTFFFTLPLA